MINNSPLHITLDQMSHSIHKSPKVYTYNTMSWLPILDWILFHFYRWETHKIPFNNYFLRKPALHIHDLNA